MCPFDSPIETATADVGSKLQPRIRVDAVQPIIVVAEDNPELRSSFALGLERIGFAVVQAANGAELVAAVRRADAALILSDVRMPGLDGIAAIRALRATGTDTPVIFLTAFGDAQLLREARKLDARLLSKPIGLRALRSVVTSVLAGSGPPAFTD